MSGGSEAAAPATSCAARALALVRLLVWEIAGCVQFLLFVAGVFVYAPVLSGLADRVVPRVTGPLRAVGEPHFVDFVDKAIPFFVASIAVELTVSKWREHNKRKKGLPGNGANAYSKYPSYRLNDTVNSMSLGMLQQLVNSLHWAKPLMYGPYLYVWEHHALVRLPADSVWTWVVCFLLVEAGYYWYHRMGHEMNVFWAAHIAHHSSQEYNLSTALRQGAVQYLFSWMYYAPGALLVPPPVFNALSAFNRIYQFWIHTEYIGRLPAAVEFVFTTPSHHRVHHAANPKYIDKNYGGTLILYDRLFGTFAAEDPAEPCVYGLTRNLQSWNVAWGNAHHFAQMWATAKRVTGLHKLRVIWNGPGWSPSGVPYKLPLKAVGEVRHNSTVSSPVTRVYIAVHYALCLVALKVIAMSGGGSALSTFELCACAGYICATLLALGGMFDRKRWAYDFDFARHIACVVAALYALYARTGAGSTSVFEWLPRELLEAGNSHLRGILGAGAVLIVWHYAVAALEAAAGLRTELEKRNAAISPKAAAPSAPLASAAVKAKDS